MFVKFTPCQFPLSECFRFPKNTGLLLSVQFRIFKLRKYHRSTITYFSTKTNKGSIDNRQIFDFFRAQWNEIWSKHHIWRYPPVYNHEYDDTEDYKYTAHRHHYNNLCSLLFSCLCWNYLFRGRGGWHLSGRNLCIKRKERITVSIDILGTQLTV